MKKCIIGIIPEQTEKISMSLKSTLKQLQTLCVEQRGEKG
jgi:hypothetical protein